MWITKRDSSILVRLIEFYISTHQPVSPAQLAHWYRSLDPRLEKNCSGSFFLFFESSFK
jgi:hypothetical protein